MRTAVLTTLIALALLLTSAAYTAPARGPAGAPAPGRLPITGELAPDFTLTDMDGYSHTLSDYTAAGNVVVLEWFNPQCPEVEKYRANSNFMNDTADTFASDPVVWLAIDSSGPGRAGSNPRVIDNFVADNGMTAPVLLDSAGDVGRDYGVMLTPTMIVIAPDRTVAYVGAPDSSAAFDRRPHGTNYIKSAVSAALYNEEPQITRTNPRGCLIPYATEYTNID